MPFDDMQVSRQKGSSWQRPGYKHFDIRIKYG